MKLADVPPFAPTEPYWKWRLNDYSEQCSAWLRKQDKEQAPINRQAIHTKRDDYGLKGVHVHSSRPLLDS